MSNPREPDIAYVPGTRVGQGNLDDTSIDDEGTTKKSARWLGYICILSLQISAIIITGVLSVLIGYQILLANNHSGYADWTKKTFAKIGAVGAAVVSPVHAIIFNLIAFTSPADVGVTTKRNGGTYPSQVFIALYIILAPVTGTLSGVIGSRLVGVNGDEKIPLILAAKAGAVGGAVLIPGLTVISAMVMCGFLILLGRKLEGK